MDKAERNGSAFLLRLRSAERLSEAAIRFGSLPVNTPLLRSSASLSRVTRCDHRRTVFAMVPFICSRRELRARDASASREIAPAFRVREYRDRPWPFPCRAEAEP